MPVWFKDSITVMSDYILAKQISPLRAVLPSLQGQPMWQPWDIEMIVGKMLHKVKNFLVWHFGVWQGAVNVNNWGQTYTIDICCNQRSVKLKVV
ncbi:hypothetical protein SDC9_109623 [bioreactor metagenome]|uniref:Uncharacterized protein n=1 Tax=bioreactor metagenome TaxID=1076179 RepID=A0A645BCC7_9ZZZZ